MKNWEALKALEEGKRVTHSNMFAGRSLAKGENGRLCEWYFRESENLHFVFMDSDEVFQFFLWEEGWKIVKETHDFAWARKQENKEVRRVSWLKTKVAWVCAGHLHKRIPGETAPSFSFISLNTHDIDATDWVLA